MTKAIETLNDTDAAAFQAALQPHVEALTADLARASRGGPMVAGMWVRAPAIPKILLGGIGSVTIDMMTASGAITVGVATFNPTGPSDDWLYFDGAVAFRATFTGSATAEII